MDINVNGPATDGIWEMIMQESVKADKVVDLIHEADKRVRESEKMADKYEKG